VRRLVLLTAVAVLAFAGVAYAVNDTLNYSAKISFKGKPTAKKPANLTYTGILKVDTNPPGSQPDTAPKTAIYYPKAIKNNAKYFPFCNQSEIDGLPFPAKCKKAIVGQGTASSLAGIPGNPSSTSVRENLTVKAVNGAKGQYIMLVLNSAPGAPVQITNRVVPGFVVHASGAFGFLTRFEVPHDLQDQLGLKIALTDFNVKINGTAKTVKVKGKTKKMSFLQITSCKGSVPIKAITQFVDNDTGTPKSVVSSSTSKC